jgi:hypothetical protein
VLIGTGRKKLPGTKRSSLFYEQNVGQFRCGGQLRIFLQEFSRLSRTTARKPHATRSTTSSSPRFRAAARRRYGCAVGRSLYDAPGPGFTLLRTDPAVETGSLLAAAVQRGVPMVVLDAGFRTNVWRLRFPRSSRNRRMVPRYVLRRHTRKHAGRESGRKSCGSSCSLPLRESQTERLSRGQRSAGCSGLSRVSPNRRWESITENRSEEPTKDWSAGCRTGSAIVIETGLLMLSGQLDTPACCRIAYQEGITRAFPGAE